MNINSMDKVRYEVLSKTLKLFKQKGWFEKLNSSNIMVFDSNKQQFALTFTSKGERVNYGITFFDGLNGIESLNDMLTLPRDVLTEASFNAIVISFKDEDELSMNDLDFFRKRKIRIKAKDNLTFLTYKEGFAPYVSTIKEANTLLSSLSLFYSVFKDCDVEVIEKFKEPNVQSMLCYVDTKNQEYSLSYGMLPTILKDVKPRKVLDYELEMFKGIPQKDYEMKLITEYINIPISIDECNKAIAPLLISTTENDLSDFSYLVSLKQDQIDQMLFFLKEYFEKNGMPTRIVFKQQYFYNAFFNLFKKFNIECSLDKTLFCKEFVAIREACGDTFKTNFLDQAFRTVASELFIESLNTLKTAITALKSNGDCEININNDMASLCDAFFMKIFGNKPEEIDEEDDEIMDYSEDNDTNLVS